MKTYNIGTIFCTITLLLCATCAYAKNNDLDYKPIGLIYYCNPNTSTVTIKESDSGVRKEDMPHHLILNRLVAVGEIVENSDREYRENLGSKTLTCGSIKTSIKGGFYNADFQGRDGGDVFTVIKVKFKNQTILPDSALGTCSTIEDDAMVEDWHDCPRQYVETLNVTAKNNHAKMTIERNYSTTEFGDTANTLIENFSIDLVNGRVVSSKLGNSTK